MQPPLPPPPIGCDVCSFIVNETIIHLIIFILVYIQFSITPVYLCVHLDLRQGNSACKGTTNK
jgi:hypothetical protein